MTTDHEPVTLDLRPPAAIYCRVSTRGQAEDGSSLDSQDERCRAHAEATGYRVAEVFREDYPGDTLDRPELIRLRALAYRRDIAGVFIYATDRLSRKPVHLAILIEEFEKSSVAVHFVTEPLDSSPEGQLIAYVKGYAAEIEREKIRERTVRGKRSRAATGRIPQGTGSGIYGYHYDPVSGKRQLSDEAETVRAIFAARIVGQTYHGIVKQLNDAAVPAHQGGRWHPLTVRRLLANETYTGKTIFGKTRSVSLGGRRRRIEAQPEELWVEVPEATPPIITAEEYAAAQAVKPKPRRLGNEYLLSGHVRCGQCGSGVTGSTLRGGYHYYRCQNTCRDEVTRRCTARMVRAEWLETHVWGQLTEALRSPAVVIEQVTEQRQTTEPELRQQLAEIDRQLRACAKYDRQLVRLFALGEFDEATIRQEAAKQRQRKEALEHKRSELGGQLQAVTRLRQGTTTLQQFCDHVAGQLETLSFDERRLLLTAVSLDVVIHSDHIDAKVVFPMTYATTAQTSA